MQCRFCLPAIAGKATPVSDRRTESEFVAAGRSSPERPQWYAQQVCGRFSEASISRVMGDLRLEMRYLRSNRNVLGCTAVALAVAVGSLSGCTTQEVFHNGYVVDQSALDLVPVGSSREQVILSLGTPSTTATFDGEVFYYISQTRTRSAAFMKQRLVEQQILAIYFDKDGIVSQRANYTMKDGKVFDMISRTTPTGGKDLTFLQQMLSGGGGAANSIKNMLGGS